MERLNLLHVGDAHGKGVRPLFDRFVRQPSGSVCCGVYLWAVVHGNVHGNVHVV